MSSSSDDDSCGPPLPPGKSAMPVKDEGKHDSLPSDESDDDAYMPALPPHLLKAASRDKHADNKHGESNDKGRPKTSHKDEPEKTDTSGKQTPESDSESDDDDDMYGPALPPHLLQKKQKISSASSKRRVVGPTLPSGYVPTTESAGTPEDSSEDADEEEGDGPIIGPAPPPQSFDEEQYRIQQLELRALRMKEKLEGKDTVSSKALVRESWMLELPEDKTNICGLAPRQFLRKTPREKGDRSVWTDTPTDKAKKAKMEAQEQVEAPDMAAKSRRDEELTVMVDDYNKSKRAKPLIDLHKKKLKCKEEESGPKERKPFSQEEDLNVNKFDEAQKSNILKKARQLNDRFSAGGNKFL